jgi:hypothetical protein
MEDILADLEKGLSTQLASLTDNIRGGEEQLMRNKEGFLKVQGALEILAVIKQRQAELNDEALKDALSTAGVD